MKTYRARFVAGATRGKEFPPVGLPEIAVVGRSNSGKSTLINILVGQRGLARVSNLPGRTRMINFFEVESRFLLVDLPGYGYASTSKAERNQWRTLVDDYFRASRPLRGVLALFDIRREPDEQDLTLVDLLRPAVDQHLAIWTKSDKVNRSALLQRGRTLQRALSLEQPGIPFSSQTRLGREELIEWIERRVLPGR